MTPEDCPLGLRRCSACGQCVKRLTPIFRLCLRCHDRAFELLDREPDKNLVDALAEVVEG